LDGDGDPTPEALKDEQIADDFASGMLITKEHEAELTSLRSEADIRSFAGRIGIAPGIVVGRLQFDGRLRRDQFNRLKTPVVFKPRGF
jgi:hypothetical protein